MLARAARSRALDAATGCAALALAWLATASPASAQTCSDLTPDCIEILSEAETTIFEGMLADSGSSSLFAGSCAGVNPPQPDAAGCPLIRRGLLRFDLASAGIPAGATVDLVEVRLCVQRVAPGDAANIRTIGLQRVLQAWGESTQVGQMANPALPGEATWNSAMHPSTWTDDGTPTGTAIDGGSFVPAISAQQSDLFASLACITFGSTVALEGDVQAWLDGTTTNEGWVLRGEEVGSGTIRGFFGREGGTLRGPQLRVEYTPAPPCGNGALDPGETCDDGATTAGDGCDDLCQIETGFSCSGAPSLCTSTCGDAVVASDEQCDDGGTTPGDGCSAICQAEPGFICSGSPSSCASVCGDGLIRQLEQCDDNGTVPGDGCSASCQVESGFVCTGEPSSCGSVCGDALITLGEQCDDGGMAAGDGCSASCQIEFGFMCSGLPSLCTSSCGDGVIAADEQCDDAGSAPGDGCSAICELERGFLCTGQPSLCASTCGDGIIASNEQCDDGGMAAGDGCSAICQVEGGFVCSGEPSQCISASTRDFVLRWSNGAGAVAAGTIQFDDGELANPGATFQSVTPFVPALDIEVLGASSGNGRFVLSDFPEIAIDLGNSGLDLTREFVGQPTSPGNFGTSGGDLALLGLGPAPTSLASFDLTSAAGAGDSLSLQSLRPVLERFASVPPSSPTGIALDVAIEGGQIYAAVGAAAGAGDPMGLLFLGAPANAGGTLLPLAMGPSFIAARADLVVALEDFGLRVIDTVAPSGASQLARIATPGVARGLAVAGDVAHALVGSALRNYDLSDPSAPVELGVLVMLGTPSDLAVVGTRVYLATGSGGLRIIDSSDAAAPLEVGSFNGLVVDAVDVAGRYAFVSSASGLAVLDVSDASSIQAVGAFATPLAGATDVVVEGRLAFVSDASGVAMLDVSDPGAPRQIGRQALSGAQRLATAGGFVVVAAGVNGVEFLRANEPFGPLVPQLHATLVGDFVALDVEGGVGFAAEAGATGVRVLDLRDPSRPGLLATIPASDALDVELVGSTLYIADGSAGLKVVDVRDPSAPGAAASVDTPGRAQGLAVVGHRVFVADGTGGLRVIDASDPSAPTEERFVDGFGDASDVSIAGSQAYVALAGGGLEVFQVPPLPGPPVSVASATSCSALATVALRAGGLAYLADGSCGLRIFLVNGPNLLPIGLLDTPGDARDVAVVGGRAFVADCTAGVRVVDLSVPNDPVEIGAIDTPGCATALDVIGRQLFVADASGGLLSIGLPQRDGCGNGVIEPGEACDDGGGSVAGDGCGGLCQVETGFNCSGALSLCTAICGDALLVGSEQCDDGGTLAGDCCSSLCDFEAAGSSCSDANACSTLDTCDGGGVCLAGPVLLCDDDLFCNGSEGCDAALGCQPGVPPALGDGVACTVDSCDELSDLVVHAPDDALCDDGMFCDGLESCDAMLGCQPGAQVAVDDGIACTTDTCDELNDTVLNVPNDAACSDGLFCNGAELCDPAFDCVAGLAPLADDGVACTLDSCDEALDRIVSVGSDALCNDGALCNGSERCDALLDCQPGQSLPVIAIEDFEALVPQNDATGVFVAASGETYYRIEAASGAVATVVAASQGVAGVLEEPGGNRFWTVDATSAGPFVAEAAIPPDPAAGFAEAGALALSFATPQNLLNPAALVCAELREVSGGRATLVRVLLGDADGNYAAADAVPVRAGSAFATVEVDPQSDALVPIGGAPSIDLTQIDSIAFELSTASGAPQGFAFDIDDVRLIPEPGLCWQAGVALAVLALLAGGRRLRRRALLGVVAGLSLMSATQGAHAATPNFTESFNGGTGGFVANPPASVTRVSTGGAPSNSGAFLQVQISNPPDADGNLGARSQASAFVGNLPADGVGGFSFFLRDVGNTADFHQVRVGIGNQLNFWISSQPFVPPNGFWQQFNVDVTNASAWTQIVGTGSFLNAVQNMDRLLFRHDPSGNQQIPATTSGEFGIDQIRVIPDCGDGLIVAGETCDDGDPFSGDGCSSTCQVEPGFSCSGQPSVCLQDPTIQLSTSTLSFGVVEGGMASSSFTIRNSGSGTLGYSLSESIPWLTLTPTGGTSTGEFDTIGVDVDTTGLSEGSFNGTITVNAPGAFNTPQLISVDLSVISSGATTVGYVVLGNPASTTPEAAILATNYAPIALGTLTGANLSAVDVLWILNPGFSYPADLTSNLAAIASFVQGGGVLLFHDRLVTGAQAILPGAAATSFTAFSQNDVEIVDDSTAVTRGPGGDVLATTLDFGSSSTHGFATLASLPRGATAILSRTDPREVVDFSYDFGNGSVHYSSIPLDFYIGGGGDAAFRDIYAPNVVAHAAQLSIPIQFFSNPDVGGFVADTANAAFLAAIGSPRDTFVSFSTDRFGVPIFPDGSSRVTGSDFSNDVIFETGDSAQSSASNQVVLANPDSISSEIGPAGTANFNGLLELDFIAAGRRATAAGFGGVQLGRAARIRVFDQEDRFVLETRGPSDATFNFLGMVVETGSSLRIGRIEIEHSSYAIQDMHAELATESLLYFSEDSNPQGLHLLSSATGAATTIGGAGVQSSNVGLAPGELPRRLYGSRPFGLEILDPIGSGLALGTQGIEGLAYDPATDTLYGAINGAFFTLDRGTGAIASSLPAPGGDVDGIAVGRGGVYGLVNQGAAPSDLRFFDFATSSWSTVGNTGVPFFQIGLAYDPKQDRLFAKGASNTNLYQIDPGTAATSIVGDTGITRGGGLAVVSFPLCGDGVREGTEQCDDGNRVGGDCCSATCGFEAFGSLCSDADVCSNGDSCDGAGSCSPGPPLACSDGAFCNGLEVCDNAAGGCVGGSQPILDDGVACTIDLCDETNDLVRNLPSDPLCSNGAFCDGNEVCDAVLDCQAGVAPTVSDGVACTLDSCDEVNDIVVNTPSNALCSNGAFCDGSEVCSPTLGCQAGTAPPTSDGIGCTIDSCNEVADVIVHTPSDVACSNGLFCDGNEVCNPTLDCQPGLAPNLNDSVACTIDSCDETADVVVHTPNDATCSNGLFCDGPEVCNPLLDCQAGVAPTLNDGIGCTDDSCDELNDVVVNATNDALCSNGLFCDGAESCDPALDCVVGIAPAIDDGVGCTTDFCNEEGDLVLNLPNDVACSDGLFCNGAEICDPALDCQPGVGPVLNDGVACTADACDEANDIVVNTPNDAACSDGLFCNGAEVCDLALDCQPGAPLVIDDGVACTSDSCDELLDLIVGAPNDAACSDGLFCNGAEICDPVLDCQPGAAPLADDGIGCTSDSCDEALDQIVGTPNDAACSDGLFCNGAEICDPALDCQPGAPPLVDDGVGCTSDACDEALDQIVGVPNDAACGDGLFCNGAELCDPLLDCQPGAAPSLDDGVGCTIDSCDEVSDRIAHAPDNSLCDNGIVCDGSELCSAIRDCVPGARLLPSLIEQFDALPIQNDAVGVFVPALGVTLQRVSNNAGDVASVMAASAGATGIAEQASGNRVWTLAATSSGPFVAEGTLPPDPATGFVPDGVLASFFSTPQDLQGALVCADARDVGGANASSRIVLSDADGNFAAAAVARSLTSRFATTELEVGVDPLELLDGATQIDLARIQTIGIEFSAPSGVSRAFDLEVDDVRLIPEPASPWQAIVALGVLCAAARWRRRFARAGDPDLEPAA